MCLPNEPNKDNNNNNRTLLQLQQLLRRNLYVNSKLNSALNRSTGGPPLPLTSPAPQRVESAMESKTNTNRHKQTKLTETAKQTEIKLLLLLSSAPLLLLLLLLHFLLLLLLRFCLLIYFHSHLLQRQQNISSCKVSGEINSASGATHTTCSRDLDPCATHDPSTLSSNFFLIFNEIWLC